MVIVPKPKGQDTEQFFFSSGRCESAVYAKMESGDHVLPPRGLEHSGYGFTQWRVTYDSSLLLSFFLSPIG